MPAHNDLSVDEHDEDTGWSLFWKSQVVAYHRLSHNKVVPYPVQNGPISTCRFILLRSFFSSTSRFPGTQIFEQLKCTICTLRLPVALIQ